MIPETDMERWRPTNLPALGVRPLCCVLFSVFCVPAVCSVFPPCAVYFVCLLCVPYAPGIWCVLRVFAVRFMLSVGPAVHHSVTQTRTLLFLHFTQKLLPRMRIRYIAVLFSSLFLAQGLWVGVEKYI